MDDSRIIELFWSRDERALKETASKYGGYCLRISQNILGNESDSEEAVNDAYLQAWRSIPPTRPAVLSAYLAKITRNIAINRYNSRRAQKRCGSEFSLSLDELGEICTEEGSVSAAIDAEELALCISDFLKAQEKTARLVFVRRYFFCDSIEALAERFGFSQSKVKSMLHRTRKRLREQLIKEGYFAK